MLTRAEAARERSRAVAQRADRPSQRRCAESGGRAAAVLKSRIEVRLDGAAGAGTAHFEGLASRTEYGYEMWDWYGPYTEIISAGAFAQSLSRSDLDVPLVLGHDQLRRMARTTTGTLELDETEDGLSVVAPQLSMADADVAYIVPKLRDGLIDEMSFAFRIMQGQWSPDYEEYRINVADIHRGDVAIVGYGANPGTDAGVRDQGRRQSERSAPGRSSARARALLELAIAEHVR